jgi:transposase-like protein
MKMGMEFWTQHVAAAKLQGALASAYAKQHGISVTALYYWQRKLKASTGGRAQSTPVSKFVPLRVAPAIEGVDLFSMTGVAIWIRALAWGSP